MAKTIITATPPTPNGDLHVGHLSGPYLAADVHARFLRARGQDVAYAASVSRAQRRGQPRGILRSQGRRGVSRDDGG